MAHLKAAGAEANKSESHIQFSQLAAYGAGGIIPIALFNIAGILVGLMGNISLGLSAFWLGVILIIPRLWDAVSDPIIGHLSDNTRTRWGRRRPFLLIGGLLVSVTFVLMWWIPKGEMVHSWFPTEAGFQAFQLVYILVALLLFYTSCTIFEIPHGALGMEITTDVHERTRLFSAKSFVGNLFAMSTPWLFALANMEIFKGTGGNEADGMRYVSLMIAAILIPLSFWWTYKLREPGFVRIKTQEKAPFWQDMKNTAGNKNFILLTLTIFTLAMGFNFVNLLGSYIPIFYIFGGDKVEGAYLLGINGTVWAVTGVLAVFPLNIISPKIGKRKTLMLAIGLMVAAQLSKIVCYNPNYPYLIVIPTMLLSMGMLFFFTLGSSMVGDICDEDDLKTGKRTEGSFYSIFWWFIKMGTALASFVAGALIVYTMFDETQVTKVDALQGSIRVIEKEAESLNEGNAATANLADLLQDAREKSTALITHFKEEVEKDNKNALHYESLIQLANDIGSKINNLNPDLQPDELVKQVAEIEKSTVALTQQSPFTLLMMRIVEIGLPVLLSIFSIFFIFRYSLTEKRSLEIKELLKERNLARELAGNESK
ncbi:MAG: MFS transporter [Bacteroidales bacterium]|nr:MFS transporter [Bacteroidales bacterium]